MQRPKKITKSFHNINYEWYNCHLLTHSFWTANRFQKWGQHTPVCSDHSAWGQCLQWPAHLPHYHRHLYDKKKVVTNSQSIICEWQWMLWVVITNHVVIFLLTCLGRIQKLDSWQRLLQASPEIRAGFRWQKYWEKPSQGFHQIWSQRKTTLAVLWPRQTSGSWLSILQPVTKQWF